jgi:hypothetical protein
MHATDFGVPADASEHTIRIFGMPKSALKAALHVKFRKAPHRLGFDRDHRTSTLFGI